MAEVILKNVDKVHQRNAKVVDNFNLHINDGEFIVLVGPADRRKSTALRRIAALKEVSDEAIEIGQKVVNDVSPKDRDIAKVFQSYALHPHMDGFENTSRIRAKDTNPIEFDVSRALFFSPDTEGRRRHGPSFET